MNHMIRSVLGIVLSFVMVSESWAIGSANISNQVISARAIGQGGADVAGVSDDLASVYSNPAAMTALKGTQVTLGGTWENLHAKFESDTGVTEKMRSADMGVPNGAVTQSFMDGKIAAGLGAFSTYGVETQWPGDGPIRYMTTNARIHMVDITPSVAVQVHPMVSVGVGADYVNFFDVIRESHVQGDALNFGATSIAVANGITPVAFVPGAPDVNTRLSGSGASWGFHTGLVVQPNERHSFGLAYHSKVVIRINGSFSASGLTGEAAEPVFFNGGTYSTAGYTDIVLPQNLHFGYAYMPTKRFTWETDAAWFDWWSSRDQNLRAPVATAPQSALILANNPTPLNLQDAWSVATGVNYKCTDKLQVRGGFSYQPSVTPESTWNAYDIDLSRYGLGGGIGYALTSALTMDFAYAAIFTHNKHINNGIGEAPGSPGGDTTGTYSNFANVVSMNFTYRFKTGS